MSRDDVDASPEERPCDECKTLFVSERSWGRFCSSVCRKRNHRRTRRLLPDRDPWLLHLESALRAALEAVQKGTGTEETLAALRHVMDGEMPLLERLDRARRRGWDDETIADMAGIPNAKLIRQHRMHQRTEKQLERWLSRYGWRTPEQVQEFNRRPSSSS